MNDLPSSQIEQRSRTGSMDDILNSQWDAVIIGTGIGGGSAGRRLAEAGMRVLFVEFGPDSPPAAENDGYPIGDAYARLMHGVWPTDLSVVRDDREVTDAGGLGAGVGGTSVFYAATLERPEPHNVDDTPERPHPTGGWPVSYAELAPYFDDAERDYHVSGEPDPLSGEAPSSLQPPIADSENDKAVRAFLTRRGLHPYRSHAGLKFPHDCRFCYGRRCPRSCKMDAKTAGVTPALATGNAALLDRCEAIRFEGTADRIERLEVHARGARHEIRAPVFVLAAGALSSPRILQRSASEAWPDGCGNASGMVGRNLMFHLNEFFALWPPALSPGEARGSRSFSVRDFYFRDGHRLGTFQALGVSADKHTIGGFLNAGRDPKRSWRDPFIDRGVQIASAVGPWIFGNADLYVGILEDLPDPQNRVLEHGSTTSGIRIEYRYPDELKLRRKLFRRLVTSSLPRGRVMALNKAPNINIPHACGTLSFGRDWRSSVLDRNCRSHQVRNLYCVDASFMPTSNGVNPSLTIAANAYRVADAIVEAATGRAAR